jgi:hypothetical protein
MATKTPATDKSDTEVVTNTGMEIVDNTVETVEVEKPVASEQYELLGGLTQVNYL